ncbi:unnamed protein product [Bemisia tabaci]|uniref:DNA repair protein RAD50 n=1 Tax=Bemisia tabaci TaxID=7038 RepID=A0A9P0AHG1_BEMTA|nr:unnamed protein product [Bemisia tabaci]
MASLVKMQILGLRSFGPDEKDAQMVAFNSPLTLILGQNGCGKTTIIEALKYATCGELPSNTQQGSGFVHDPKINNRVEVRGQVKLVCTTTKGEQVCIARSVQVQQKVKKLTFKSLDTTITRINPETKEKESLSGRCADVDTEMCYRLGVTKPILNYVIFCHQEESCWPLEENKKLKEKFDAIFDSTKYNRCLEDTRLKRKNMIHDVNIKKSNLVYLKQFQNDAIDKQKALDETKAKLVQTQTEIVELQEKEKPIQEKLIELKEQERNATSLNTKIEGIKGRLKELLKSKDHLNKLIINRFEGTDEELQAAIDSFDEDHRVKKDELKQLEPEKSELLKEQKKLDKDISKKTNQVGQLSNAEDQHKSTIAKCNHEINNLGKKLEIEAYNTTQMTATSTDSKEKLDELNAKIEERQNRLEELHKSHENAESLAQKKIDECREKRSACDAEIKSKETQLKKVNADFDKVTADILAADESANTLVALENKLTRLNSELEEFEQSVNLPDLEKLINDQKDEKYQLGDEIKALKKERENLLMIRDQQTELDKLNIKREEQESKIQRLKNKHQETIEHLLGEIPEERLKSKFQSRLDEIKKDTQKKDKMVKELNDKMIGLKANRKNKAEKLVEMETELRTKETEIYDLCENRDFDIVLNEIADEIKTKQDLKGTWYGTEFLYNKYIGKLQQPNACCPLCHRDFDAQSEAIELKEEIEGIVRKIPQQSEDIENQLKVLLVKHEKLLLLKPTIEKVRSLKDIEIPSVRSELEDLDKEMSKLQRESSDLEGELEQPRKDAEMASSAQSDIINLDTYMTELVTMVRQISDLSAKLGTKGKDNSYEQVSEELQKKEEAHEKLSRNFDSNQTKLREESKRLNDMKEKKNKLVQEQLDLRDKSQRRAELGDKQTELQTQKDTLRKEIDEKKDELQPLDAQLKSLMKEKSELSKENRKLYNEERNIVTAFEQQYHSIVKLQNEIENYERKGGSATLDNAREELKVMVNKMEELKAKEEVFNGKINGIREFLSNLQSSRMDLTNNQMLRQKDEEENKYNKQITELTEQHGDDLNLRQLRQETQKCSQEAGKISHKIGQAQGAEKELQNSIKAAEKELQADKYKNAAENYRNLLIEVKAKELAAADLGNYILALDWAMIHFHKERMKTINTIIRNLWRQIYSGNDIDTIEIKTEESDSNSADKRRMYNYRVVCRRGDVEMDMRGRCSAGQKVLACLIIRMALAETFSKNCGILALDEPTTNLDQENIDSLSTALADIISHRSRQKNFQLIVITHDEDFLLRLSHSEKIPYYLKVHRNQHGKSEVQQVAVN